MYIINPMWVYLIEQLTSIRNLFFCLLLVVIILFFFLGTHENEEGDLNFSPKRPKTCLIVGLICLTCGMLTPTKETGYRILIASVVTTDRLQAGHDLVAEDLKSILDNVTGSVKDIIETAKK